MVLRLCPAERQVFAPDSRSVRVRSAVFDERFQAHHVVVQLTLGSVPNSAAT